MSWLKKLFPGKRASDESGVANISSVEMSAAGRAALAEGVRAPAKVKAAKLLPRAERVSIQRDHQIDISIAGRPGAVPVQNISLTGVAFASQGVSLHESVELRIRIGANEFRAMAQIVRIEGSVVGARLNDPAFELTAAIANYLQVEILAMRVVEIAQRFMKPVDRGEARWFEGERRSGLYYVAEAGNIRSFTLSVLGSIVEWTVGQPPRFGQTQNNPDTRVYTEGSKVEWEKAWSVEMLTLANRFVRSIAALPSAHAEQVLGVVAKIPTI